MDIAHNHNRRFNSHEGGLQQESLLRFENEQSNRLFLDVWLCVNQPKRRVLATACLSLSLPPVLR